MYDFTPFMKCYVIFLSFPVIVPILLSDLILLFLSLMIVDDIIKFDKVQCQEIKTMAWCVFSLSFLSLALKLLLIGREHEQVKGI